MISASFINAVVSCFCFLASAIAAVISFLLFLNISASAWSRRHSVSSFNRSSTCSSLSGRPLFRRLSLTISGFSLTTLMSSKTGSRSRFSPSVKKPMSSLVVPRLFKDQAPLAEFSLGVTPARRGLFRSRQPHRQRLRHGRDRRLEMPVLPPDLLRRQAVRRDRPRPRSRTSKNRARLEMGCTNLHEKHRLELDPDPGKARRHVATLMYA